MSIRRYVTRAAVAGAVLAVLTPAAGHAQGWIEPRPLLPTSTIEKLRTSVTVSVSDRVATVVVEEWFRNNGGPFGEADYVYPLPGEAVFSGYSLYQGDTELRGEMMDATEARAIYERIVRERRDPALIELVGKGLVRARVFPFGAGETRRITLRYTQVLERAGDALQYRYAAGVRHAGDRTPVRFPPPQVTPLTRPDPVQRPESTQRAGPPLTFTMTVEDGASYRDPFSPTHGVTVQRRGGRITVTPRSELAGDFAVYLPFAANRVGMTVATHRPAGDDGYFMLTLSPSAVAESRIPRDVSMVIDVSGSMSGEKMEQARAAAHQLLGTLGVHDRFRLIGFSSAVRPWRDGWTQANAEGLRAARSWVDGLRAEGGTHISGALENALEMSSPAARLPIVLFLTDGMATNGETRTDRIIAMTESLRGRTRVFAFGVGYDVNTHLLDALSEAARGTTQYVQPGESVEEVVSLLATRIRYPVLTDLALERGPVRLTDVQPRQLPDLFAGEDLLLFGRYSGSGTGAVVVSGRRDNDTERYRADARFPARTDANDYIPRLWASRKLGDLDRRIRSARADGASRSQVEELTTELRELAMRYGLLSQYTAYLVQEPQVVAMRGGQGAPGGTFSAMAGEGAAVMSSPAPAVTGRNAVVQAEDARRAREATSLADVEAMARRQESDRPTSHGADVRTAGGRTFRVQDGVWQDVQDAGGLRVIRVAAWSRAYFDLLQALPEVAAAVRELGDVQLTGSRVVLRITEAGVTTLDAAAIRRIADEFRSR
jgi:Ca-activated chloride channel homolog